MAFTVTEFHDLVRLLEVHPEWRAELRRLVIPEALVDLPRALEALAEAQRRTEATLDRMTERMERGFAEAAAQRAEAAADRQRIWEALREGNERMERGFAEAAADRQHIWEAIRQSNERMEKGFAEAAADRQHIWEVMERGFAEAAVDRQRIWEAIRQSNERMEKGFAEAAAERQTMLDDLGRLKGSDLERFYRDQAPAIFGRRLTGGRNVTSQVADQLQSAFQAGSISREDYDQVLWADLLWGGQVRATGEEVVLVLEAAWQVDDEDVTRADERAAILRRAGFRALPVAAGREWPIEVETLAHHMQVVILQDGRVDEASWQAALDGM